MRELLRALLSVPKGYVTTYKALGEKFNVSPRQVGRILHTNTHLEKYPCYKVVRSDGSIAVGYAGGGRAEQIRRLKKDNVPFRNNRVDLYKALSALD